MVGVETKTFCGRGMDILHKQNIYVKRKPEMVFTLKGSDLNIFWRNKGTVLAGTSELIAKSR